MQTRFQEPTLAELALSTPGAAAVFHRRGLDYCCRGRTAFTEACLAKGLVPAEVHAEIEAFGGSDDDVTRFAGELVNNLNSELARAQPDISYSNSSFGKLIQETGLFTPGSMERARGLYESLLEVGIKPNERRELLVELEKQQDLSIDIIRAVQEQVKKWEGFDDILHGFRDLRDNQEETIEDIRKEVR